MPKQRLKAKAIVLTIVAVLASLWFFNFINLNFLPQALSAPPQCTEPEIEAGIDMLKNQDISAFDLLVQCQSKSVLPLTQVLIYTQEENVELIAIAILAQIGSQASAAIPVLDTLLQDPNTDVRIATVYALQEIGKDAIPSLMTAIKNEDYNVSYRANNAVVKIGKNAILPLIKILKGKDNKTQRREAYFVDETELDSIRYEAANILAEIGEDSIPELINILKTSGDGSSFLAAKALIKIGTKESVRETLNYLKHNNNFKRKNWDWELLESLMASIQDEEAIKTIINALKDENSKVRSTVAMAVKQMGKKAVPLLASLIKDPNNNFKYIAVEILGQNGKEAKETVPELIIALKDQNSDVRSKAAEALGRIKAKEAVPELIIALKDQNSDVRSKAAEALGRIKAKEAVPELIIALKDQNSDVRSKAAEALGRIKAKEAVPELIIALKDQNSNVRSKAAEALGRIKAKEAVPELIIALKDQNSDVRSKAAKALVRIKAKEAVPELIIALKDQNSDVRIAAAEILGQTGEEAKEAVPQLTIVLKDSDSNVQYKAAEALDKIKAKEAVPLLINLLKDQNNNFSHHSPKILDQTGDKTEEEVPTTVFKDQKEEGEEEQEREEREGETIGKTYINLNGKNIHICPWNNDMNRLAKIKHKEEVPLLIGLLEDINTHARAMVIEILGGTAEESEEKFPTPILKKDDMPMPIDDIPMPIFEDENSYVCPWAGVILAEIKAKEAVPLLINLLKDTNSNVRDIAAEILGQTGEKAKEAVPELISVLQDEDSYVRSWAAWALGKIKAKEATSELIIVLKDRDKDVRNVAAWALGKIKAKEAKSELIMALKDRDRTVRDVAAWALGEIKAKEAIPELIAVLINNINQKNMFFDRVTNNTNNALIKIGKDAVPLLTILLKNPNSDVRFEAVKMLGKIGKEAKEALPTLISILENKDEPNKLNAAISIVKIGGELKYTIPALIENLDILDNHCDEENNLVTEILEKVGTQAVSALIAAFKEKDWHIRYGAASALGRIDLANGKNIVYEKIVPEITKVFLDETEYIKTRSLAVNILEHLASDESTSVLNTYRDIVNTIKTRMYRSREFLIEFCPMSATMSARAATTASISSKTPVACQIPLIRYILKWKCS